jgi:hypothetical protein
MRYLLEMARHRPGRFALFEHVTAPTSSERLAKLDERRTLLERR